MTLPKKATLVEVGPRDGLQNEKEFLSTDIKVELIRRLAQTGLQYIEATSFVSAKAIPQLADGEEVLTTVQSEYPCIDFSALVPNIVGLERALKQHCSRIALFTAASETFNQKNIRASIDESLKRFEAVIIKAKEEKLFIRAYISCVLGCPYEGDIAPEKVASLAKTLLELGADEICLGDTIGVGTPEKTKMLIQHVEKYIPMPQLAMHFHDTYGQAIANIYASLQQGVNIFDSAVAGLGGCPYAKGASGNVASEDVLYLLNGLNIETGVELQKMIDVGNFISAQLKRVNQSKVANALSKKN